PAPSPSSASATSSGTAKGAQRMGEHVVDLAGDPGPLVQSRGARLLPVRQSGLYEQLVGLLGVRGVLAAVEPEQQGGGQCEGVPRDRRRAGVDLQAAAGQ